MKEFILGSIFIFFSSSLLLAQGTLDQSYIRTVNRIVEKNALDDQGGSPESFNIDKGEAVVKIKWDAEKLNYQLIYKKVPELLTRYINVLHPNGKIVTITFLDKEGFEITQRSCYVNSFSYENEGKTLVCRNFIPEDTIYANTTINDYHKIASVIAVINSNPTNY